MNHNFIRPGGVAADLPDGWQEDVLELCEQVEQGVAEYDDAARARTRSGVSARRRRRDHHR